MKDPLVEVLKTVTPEQARLIHNVLSGWAEDLRCEFEREDKECEHLAAGEALVEKLDAAMASYAGPLTAAEKSADREPAKPKCELATEFCSGSCLRRYKGTKKNDPEFVGCIACVAIMKRRGLKLKEVR